MVSKKTIHVSDFLKSLHVIGITEQEIRSIAYQTGFLTRVPKKIDAPGFLSNMCSLSCVGLASFNNIASRYHISYNITASKQAFWKKVNEPCVRFFQAVLERLIKLKISDGKILILKHIKAYKRILVQDSTIIKLPYRLFDMYSGVSNQHSAVCNARIQGVYDLISGGFISFSIDPYSKNDLAAAPKIKIQEGDLVLRDRGYYINDEIKRHLDVGADCIYRYKHKTFFLDPVNGQTINLLEVLEKNQTLDIILMLNNQEKTKVRLVAFPVNEEIGNIRRMKAKKDCRKQNMSEEALKLMSWTIFITTIPSSTAGFNELLAIYRLRWRIEIIFKIWKSYMKFAKVHNVSQCQLQVLLLSRFIMIVVCICIIYCPFYTKIRNTSSKHLSLMKFINYLFINQEMVFKALQLVKDNTAKSRPIVLAFIKYCTYDTRKRMNYNQLSEKLFLS